MKLQEKILYCRKKSGLSQEALAELLGVSRQAISKWETGDATPEISKLLLLANAFNVSTDWLLSDEDPVEESQGFDASSDCEKDASGNSWIEHVPGLIGRLLRRYGWLFGVYLAVSGALFTGMGALARFMVQKMLGSNPFGSIGSPFPDGTLHLDQFAMSTVSSLATNNPVSIMGTAIMIFGIVLIIGGTVLAIVLKKHSK